MIRTKLSDDHLLYHKFLLERIDRMQKDIESSLNGWTEFIAKEYSLSPNMRINTNGQFITPDNEEIQ